jgi:enoyl-CoA hydratase/carnithine racemase
MTYQTIKTERDGSAFVIAFNRPEKRNAISTTSMEEILHAVASVETDPAIFGIVITGNAEFFSAGADLNDALREMAKPGSAVRYMTTWRTLNRALENSAKPVIAAVEGFCMTGGFELTLACDLRVAGEGSSFAITSARIGTVPGSGGTQRLPRLVGVGNALEILLSAEPITAEHAYRIGLLNRLVPKGRALEEAKAMIRIFEKRAPMSLKLLKRAVYAGTQMDLDSAIEFESFVVSTIYQTNDKQEGITAFLEKRQAVFKGD